MGGSSPSVWLASRWTPRRRVPFYTVWKWYTRRGASEIHKTSRVNGYIKPILFFSSIVIYTPPPCTSDLVASVFFAPFSPMLRGLGGFLYHQEACERVDRSLADGNAGRDLVLDVNHPRREDLCEVLGLMSSCSTAFASAGSIAWVNSHEASTAPHTGVLAELLVDVVDEVLAVGELTIGSDSHDPLVHTRC